jgi:DNA-binding Lrp family transcriptional regulator
MATNDLAEIRSKVADYLKANPDIPYRVLAERLLCSLSTVSAIAREHGITRRPRVLSAESLKVLGGESK